MADDFDDDLFNAYNQASDNRPIDNSHESFEDEFADALDTTKDDTHQQDRYMEEDDGHRRSSSPPPPPPPRHQQQQNQQQQNYNNYTNQQRYYQQGNNNNNQQTPQTVMMGGVPMPYQMALAYQQQMQQMMANPLQLQMMQQQYRQMQQQQMQQQRRPFQQRSQHPPEDKEALERKMFIGGLDWETTDDSLKDHFSKFGPVSSCSVMREAATGQSRGFAFVSMMYAADVEKVLEQTEHIVDGKKIDPKRAVSRSEQPTTSGPSHTPDEPIQSEKIFVGGISPSVDQDEFKRFFEQFGTVAEATLMMDRQTGKPRGFGFITFEDVTSVDRALDANPEDLEIKEKRVEIKRATPKTKSMTGAGARPNTRYAGAALGRPFPQQQQPYAAMAAAAAAYYGGGGGGGNGGGRGDDDDYHRRHHRDHRDHRDHHHRSSRHRDSSRDDRYRGGDDRSGGGAVHASSTSRNQSSYRPY